MTNKIPSTTHLTFAPLKKKGLRHAFTLRGEEGERILEEAGFEREAFVSAEQIHSDEVAVVTAKDCGKRIARADALVTKEPEVTLVIRTADCAPIFLYDPARKAIGLVHSGKKGTEQDVLTRTVDAMKENFGTEAKNLIAVVGPCIRPPDYEVDFAAEIARQAKQSGIISFHDCGLNTASDLSRFYSYRAEKGKTSRHYSVMVLGPAHTTGCI